MRKTLGLAIVLFAAYVCAADTLVLKDGTSHNGILVSATSQTISFREGGRIHRYARSKVQSVEFSGVSMAAATETSHPGSSPTGHGVVTLPAGAEITVLSNENIDSSTATEGQVFPADVAENITNAAGQIVIPKGSEAELVIRKVQSAGTVGTPELALDLQSVKVGGRRYTISTVDVEEKGSGGLGKNKRTAEMVGGGALLGTLIGAVAGGGKGAAIGAATGAAAGAGAQILTRGKTVKVPAETKLKFKLDQPLRLTPAY